MWQEGCTHKPTAAQLRAYDLSKIKTAESGNGWGKGPGAPPLAGETPVTDRGEGGRISLLQLCTTGQFHSRTHAVARVDFVGLKGVYEVDKGKPGLQLQ